MAKNYAEVKNRRESTGFTKLPYCVQDSPNFTKLSSNAIRLLLDLIRQHRGSNNGALIAAWSCMQKRGWRSPDTLHYAILELLHFQFVVRTKVGGKNRYAHYALTWTTVDVSDDESYRRLYVETGIIPNLYKTEQELYKRPAKKAKKRAKLIAISGTKFEPKK